MGNWVELLRENSVNVNLKGGFNRMFLTLTVGWAIFCAVVYPLHVQYEGLTKALSDYNRDVKTCQESGFDGLNDCLDLAKKYRENAVELYSLKRFYIWDVALWRVLLPAIAVPPIVLYGLSKLTVWIWRGFKPRAST